jgi:hypothetical protein
VAQANPRSSPPRSRRFRRRPPIFEAGIEIIQLAVSVMDAHNRYVTGLLARLRCVEDGVRQTSLFNHDDIPISLAVI